MIILITSAKEITETTITTIQQVLLQFAEEQVLLQFIYVR